MPAPTLKGQLLVSTTPTGTGPFDRSVVLLLEHAPDHGALGVVVNRPSRTPVGEILPRWAGLASTPDVFFIGGPVSPSGVIGVGRAAVPVTTGGGWQPVLPTVGALDLDGDPSVLVPTVESVRLFAGYAGWSPAQLEAEIDAGGWFVCDALPHDVFSDDPDQLWSAVLRRQGGKLAVYASIPPDPTLN